MRDLVDLGMPLPVWHALKFLVIEAVVSLLFAPLWARYIRSRVRLAVLRGPLDGDAAQL